MQDSANIVVAVGTQRRSDCYVGVLVLRTAHEGPAMAALGSRHVARVTLRAVPKAVHEAETRGGKSQEDGRVAGNGLVDTLAAFESRSDEVAGVTAVGGCTRGALQSLRVPHVFRTTPSGSEALETTTVRSPSAPLAACPGGGMGWRHHPQPSPWAKKSSSCRRRAWRPRASTMARSSGFMATTMENGRDKLPAQNG